MLQPGDKLPDFSLLQTDGSLVRSSGFQGRRVVLYFYPKDDTTGCTTEACSIRDSWAKLREKQVMVYGISPDAVASHRNFAAKYDLPFPCFRTPITTLLSSSASGWRRTGSARSR